MWVDALVALLVLVFFTLFIFIVAPPESILRWIQEDDYKQYGSDEEYDPLIEEIEQALEDVGSIRPRMNSAYR